jgi:hypothetical protein
VHPLLDVDQLDEAGARAGVGRHRLGENLEVRGADRIGLATRGMNIIQHHCPAIYLRKRHEPQRAGRRTNHYRDNGSEVVSSSRSIEMSSVRHTQSTLRR